MKAITYYAFEFTAIAPGASATLKLTLPENQELMRLNWDTAQGSYKIVLTDVKEQKTIGKWASITNALDGYELSGRVGTQLEVTVQNFAGGNITPVVTVKTKEL